MAFAKLDCNIVDSSLWGDRDARDIFITALCKAEPHELREEHPALKTRETLESGFVVPPGWYGFVPAAGPGLVRAAGIDMENGIEALERLASPDPDSRDPAYDGRRLVRVNGGYIVLNFNKYREKDHTAAERSRRYRERRKASRVTRDATQRNVTVTEAEAEAEEDKIADPDGVSTRRVRKTSAGAARSNRVGSANSHRSVSAVGREYRAALWSRLQAVALQRPGEPNDGRDPPEYVEWWRGNSRTVVDLGGIDVLEAAVKYAEDCRDPAVRTAKDLGKLARPSAFIASKLQSFLEPLGKSLSPPPRRAAKC